jgi:hypothetical protein
MSTDFAGDIRFLPLLCEFLVRGVAYNSDLDLESSKSCMRRTRHSPFSATLLCNSQKAFDRKRERSVSVCGGSMSTDVNVNDEGESKEGVERRELLLFFRLL